MPTRVIPTWLTWLEAMTAALYGPAGFYRTSLPCEHFRTSAHSEQFAIAVARLVRQVDEALGHPATFDVIDVGAGGGELLRDLDAAMPARVRLVGVDVAGRPSGLPTRIGWSLDMPRNVRGVVLANEWLDNVPVDIAEVDESGLPRLVLVDPATGAERLGRPVDGADARWLKRWWPLVGSPAGTRAEIGRLRDQYWTDCVGRLASGVAIAIDYDHDKAVRPPRGTLTGYRSGRVVEPVPNGSCDLTAHVALDACASAVAGDGVSGVIARQRDVLCALGVDASRPRLVEGGDPAAYVRGLARASEAWLLTAVDGVGSFGWLAHPKGIPLPIAFAG